MKLWRVILGKEKRIDHYQILNILFGRTSICFCICICSPLSKVAVTRTRRQSIEVQTRASTYFVLSPPRQPLEKFIPDLNVFFFSYGNKLVVNYLRNIQLGLKNCFALESIVSIKCLFYIQNGPTQEKYSRFQFSGNHA